MTQPLVTICLLSHNGEHIIAKALQSLVDQDYPNTQIIVSDNYSTDRTPEIVKEFQARHNNISYRRNEQPILQPGEYTGCYYNYNACITSGEIKGEIVAFCHDDDIYKKDYISKTVDFLLSHPAAEAVFTMADTINEHDAIIGRHILPKQLRGKKLFNLSEILHQLLLDGNTFLITPALVTRTKTFNSVGLFNEKTFRGVADIDMWMRMLEKGPLGIINQPLMFQRINGDGKMYNETRVEQDEFFTVLDFYLKKYSGATASKKALTSYQFQKLVGQVLIAVNFLANNRRETAKQFVNSITMGNAMKAFCYHPTLKKIRGLLLLLVVVVGFYLHAPAGFWKTLRGFR